MDGFVLQQGVGAPNKVLGTTTNDNAAAGYVGEYIESIVLSGSAVSLTTAIAANVTSISLTGGDWDVSGTVIISRNAATSMTQNAAWVSTTSATQPTAPAGGIALLINSATVGTTLQSFPVGTTRFSLSGTTTVYLGVLTVFTVNTSDAYGIIRARRVR